MWRVFSLAVVVCLMCLSHAKAQTVNETESSIILNETTADISLVVENSAKSFDGKVELELIDIEGKVRANTSQNVKIKSGKETYKLLMPLGDVLKTSNDEIAWYRLRYRVGETGGIVSLSQIIKDIFELRVIASDNLMTGMTYRNRIRAIHPFTNQPIEGVKVTAELKLELKGDVDKPLNLTAAGETDAEGFVVLDFQIPIEANLDDGNIKITGRKGGIVREADDNLQTLSNDFQFPMMSDKPIYQPEQTLNVRGILFKGGEEKTVAADSEVEFKIEDEDNMVLYREKVKTSEFGVAAISWKIPENAKLGTYRIRVKNQTNDESDYVGFQRVKISRYDLPNFAVTAKALKPYYLPAENQAEVEVRADYLFGKPVNKGKVRVVQETSREWNYREQKYEIKEGETHEGETDAEGKFTAKFDLTEVQEDLKDSSYYKFRDIHLTAYFTDLTTNRTEQRRFDVRVTREPIHVYFIGDHDDHNPKLPVNAYVSTFYADGSPAVCDVEIKGRNKDGDSDEKFKTIQRLKTNSYGAGKVNFMRPKYEDASDNLEFQIIARDKSGLNGTYGVGEDDDDKKIDFDDADILQINTEKTIYKAGESVKIKFNSTKQKGLVYIDIVKGWSVIGSRLANLEGGKAEIKIPYQTNFQGELKIAAYIEDENDDLIKTSRGIIFPTPQTLKLDASFDKAVYKPGEEAKVNFGVLNTIGKAVESVLGVVIFDKAIEERARTESEFSGTFSNYSGWLGYGDSFGSVNVKDLNELDLSKPIPDELQLVAEVMLHDSYYYPNIFRSSANYYTNPQSVYGSYFKKQFEPIEKALNQHYGYKNYEHPIDEQSLQKILTANGFNFDNLRDPWEQNYRASFQVSKTQDILQIICAGADKKFNTKDDFMVSTMSFAYFAPTGKAIDKAVTDYYKRTGNYIRDEKTLFQELGISELKDRFDRPYKITFEVQQRYFAIRLHSFGKDGVFSEYNWEDDFDIWTNKIDYFMETELKINHILLNARNIPIDEDQLKYLLKTNKVNFDEILDGYGEKVYLVKREFSRFTNIIKEEIISEYGKEKTTARKTLTPVTQGLISFQIRSKGADKKENTSDDFTLAEFAKVISEQTKDDIKPQKTIQNIVFTNGTGAISGTLTDPSGAAIPNASITATNSESNQSQSVTTDADGRYLINNLAVGNYSIKADITGFKSAIIQNISVTANSIVTVDIVVEAGSVSEQVTVTAGAAVMQTSASVISEKQIANLPKGQNFISLLTLKPGITGKEDTDNQNSQKSTPKLREYFPETLVWSPGLITGKDGKAELKFKLADNITTWKLYTIASTKNGKVGITEKEITAFQPFFVDLEPPKFLTQGDEIFLPTQIRNYTPTKQKVDVTMAKSDWFSFLNADKQQIEVDKNSANNAVFGFKAISSIKDGKQKVTAIAAKDSDAIEKPVTVRPNGQEIVKTESKLFTNSASFDVNFPSNALPKTPKSELKIYPNLMAHVTESVEGLLQRPYGCGEQTISSTYPNLMILKFIKTENSLTNKAKKNLQKGYERLLGYQISDGGFSYWGGKDSSDIPLTAYALRFLNDAKPFIEVDEKVIENAANYLIKQQLADGSWTKKYSWETSEDKRRTKIITSYIAKTLAALKAEKPTLNKALNYLKVRNAEIDEPYALALYALASFDAGDIENASKTVEKLRTMAKEEAGAVYWNLESNTPFYGWGTAGRIETTALVLQALLREKKPNDELVSKAAMFLLKSKDRYGVWYSTQTTINVLDSFLASLTTSKNQTISVSINGEKLKDINVSADQIEPIVLDLTDKITNKNQVEITTSENTAVISQVVNSYYIDWENSEVSNRNVNDSRQIRLDYKCDKLDAKIMETVNCSVEAERIGFRGYGMLLAEIGLPPGAEVSRESLEKAFGDDWSLSRYDILPDRIVVYMWSKAGGSKFNFSFKPRYRINAQTPASTIYDYYNEEAKAIIAPMKFNVK